MSTTRNDDFPQFPMITEAIIRFCRKPLHLATLLVVMLRIAKTIHSTTTEIVVWQNLRFQTLRR
jgi:hypothetical protein